MKEEQARRRAQTTITPNRSYPAWCAQNSRESAQDTEAGWQTHQREIAERVQLRASMDGQIPYGEQKTHHRRVECVGSAGYVRIARARKVRIRTPSAPLPRPVPSLYQSESPAQRMNSNVPGWICSRVHAQLAGQSLGHARVTTAHDWEPRDWRPKHRRAAAHLLHPSAYRPRQLYAPVHGDACSTSH